jgi:hypothetical protein
VSNEENEEKSSETNLGVAKRSNKIIYEPKLEEGKCIKKKEKKLIE